MGDHGALRVEGVIGLGERTGRFHQEGDGVEVITFFGQGYHPLKLADVILNRRDAMMGIASDVGILFPFEPVFNNQGAVGNRTAHILDSEAKRQHNLLMSQRIEVSAKRALPTVEQPAGQVFDGQQAALLEGFDTLPHHPEL